MIEISPEISGEALRFLLFMLAGILLILAFDLFRILRRLIPHRTGVVAVEDMLYCIGSAIFIFIMLCRENDGAIRGFLHAGHERWDAVMQLCHQSMAGEGNRKSI